MQIDYLVIEDVLYTTLIRSYVLEYSSPKVTVLENPTRSSCKTRTISYRY